MFLIWVFYCMMWRNVYHFEEWMSQITMSTQVIAISLPKILAYYWSVHLCQIRLHILDWKKISAINTSEL